MAEKRGLVISGGGAKGAWAVGVLRYLMQEQGQRFDLVVGTSTGAMIAPLAALGGIDRLREFYTSLKASDVLGYRFTRCLKLNAAWAVLTGQDSVYTTKPLRRTVAKAITEQHWQKLIAGPVQAWVDAVNMQTGVNTYFGSHEPEMKRERFLSAMVAAASIPVFMEQAQIDGEGNGFRFVDGGVRDLIPIGHAIREGATDLTVIILGPEPPPENHEFRRIYQVLQRTIDLQGEETAANDETFGELVTRELNWRERLKSELLAFCSQQQIDHAFAKASEPNEPLAAGGRKFVSVSFHLLRPDKEIGPTLEFKPELMVRYEQEGRDFASDPAHWKNIP
jgi:predicted acylesterase/phospholipase RssA